MVALKSSEFTLALMVTVTLLSSLLFSWRYRALFLRLPVVPISLLCYRYLPCWRTSPARVNV
ncbi:hypothetical protein ACLK19_05345 [Escherichia coli]